MRLSRERLNRATLARQLLLERVPLEVTAAVRRVVALQGQEPAAPYVALWNRVLGFDPRELDEAFASFRVVRATLMRITLHVVAAEDHAPLHAAMLPRIRASRVNDRRFREVGLEPADADRLVPALLEVAADGATPDEIEAALAAVAGDRYDPRLWWALRTYAPVLRAPTGGPWSFRAATAHVSAPWSGDRPPDRDRAMQHLVRRYLAGFGPASVADLAQFTLQTRRELRTTLRAMADELVAFEGPAGERLHDLPGAPLPAADVPAPPRLLGMWDSTLLAYDDRSRVLPDEHRRVVIRRNGDTLPTVLVDGYVAGVWRQLPTGIEVTAFRSLDDATWEALGREAASLRALLDARDERTFGRYHRWWDRLPDGERRVLS